MQRLSFFEKLVYSIQSNPGTKLVSILAAVLLWVVVLGSRNVEIVKEVSLDIVTAPDLTPSNEIPEKVAFRISGPKAFLRAVSDRREDPIRVNLVGAKPGVVTYRFFSDNIRLPLGVKVLSINPPALTIKLESVRTKELPVKLDLRGKPPQGYRLIRSEVRPERIKIRGPESRVDGMSELRTLPVDLSLLKGSIDREAPLDLQRYNLQIDGPLPKVSVELEPVSANVRLKNIDLRVLSKFRYQIKEKAVSVLVRADEADVRELSRGRIFAIIDLSKEDKGTYRVPVKVNLPSDVGLVKVIPEVVTVTLY